jgi:hypothetical protein
VKDYIYLFIYTEKYMKWKRCKKTVWNIKQKQVVNNLPCLQAGHCLLGRCSHKKLVLVLCLCFLTTITFFFLRVKILGWFGRKKHNLCWSTAYAAGPYPQQMSWILQLDLGKALLAHSRCHRTTCTPTTDVIDGQVIGYRSEENRKSTNMTK